MNKETTLMHKIMVALSEKGCFIMRTNSGTFFDRRGEQITIGFPGLSDLIGCTPSGRLIALEVKLPGQKPRSNQLQFIERMKGNNAIAGWCTSIEEALKIVEGGENGNGNKL